MYSFNYIIITNRNVKKIHLFDFYAMVMLNHSSSFFLLLLLFVKKTNNKIINKIKKEEI
jgi:hypothetical protein